MSLRGGQAAGRGSLCLGPAGGLRNVRSPQELSSHLCPFPALVVTNCHPILFTGEASSCVASSSHTGRSQCALDTIGQSLL